MSSPEPFDLEAFEAHVATIPADQFSGALQALIAHKERLQAQPLVTAREDEIARAYHEAHPPQVDEVSGHPVWSQPAGAHDAWPIDAVVVHDGRVWQNIARVPNVWQPGADGPVPTWADITPADPDDGDSGDGEQPDDEPGGPAPYAVGVDYTVGDEFTYQGATWRVLQAHTSAAHWPPEHSHSLYTRI